MLLATTKKKVTQKLTTTNVLHSNVLNAFIKPITKQIKVHKSTTNDKLCKCWNKQPTTSYLLRKSGRRA